MMSLDGSKRYPHEENIMYLLAYSRLPTVDSVVSTIRREEKRRQVDKRPPVDVVYVEVTILRIMSQEFAAVGAEDKLILHAGVIHLDHWKLVPFFASRVSMEQHPGTSYVMIIDTATGEIYGI